MAVAEPWRFRLGEGRAEIQSPVRFPEGCFPTTEAQLLAQVRAAVAAPAP